MSDLLALYASIVTVVLFFQGLDISKWYAEVQRLQNYYNDRLVELKTDKRKAEGYCSDVEFFLSTSPGIMARVYLLIQVLLIGISIIVIVPVAFSDYLFLGEIPFCVLFLLCVVGWPLLEFIDRHSLKLKVDYLRKRHHLSGANEAEVKPSGEELVKKK